MPHSMICVYRNFRTNFAVATSDDLCLSILVLILYYNVVIKVT